MLPADANRNRTTHHAFTLIELMVILAIIAILAALLFPVLAQARKKPGSCLSDHRQLVAGAALYTSDYDETDYLPAPHSLNPYIKTIGRCPLLAPVSARRFLEAQDHMGSPTPGGNMTYHGGAIMPTSVTTSIFWGRSWGQQQYVGDKISGLDAWYSGFGNSNYARASDEYTGRGLQVTPSSVHIGHVIDTSAAKRGDNPTVVLEEVCRAIPNPDPSGNGYYPVYTDLPRGNAGFCAWHAAGTCHGTQVQIAYFWDLTGDPGCDPRDNSGLHSQGLAALANVSGHELSEARTDPAGNSWYNGAGEENGDLCAWTFGAPLVTFADGRSWKIQGEWSDKAFSSHSGYSNLAGERGCLSGR